MTKRKEPRGTAGLSWAVEDMLRAETNEANRFASMELCEEIMDRCDLVRDQLMRDTLRGWIGKIQEKFQA